MICFSVGQQLVIILSLFLIVVSVTLLFIIYLILNVIIRYENFLKEKFKDNKILKVYVTYQLFLVKVASFHIPITILIGLLVLIHGMHFLITHQIPYSDLGVDLSTFIKSK